MVRSFLSLHDHEQGNPDGMPPSLESPPLVARGAGAARARRARQGPGPRLGAPRARCADGEGAREHGGAARPRRDRAAGSRRGGDRTPGLFRLLGRSIRSTSMRRASAARSEGSSARPSSPSWTGDGSDSASATIQGARRCSSIGRRTRAASGARCRRVAIGRRFGRSARVARTTRVTTARPRPPGPGGEPVDLWRTLVSHGFAELSPMRPGRGCRYARAHGPRAGRTAAPGGLGRGRGRRARGGPRPRRTPGDVRAPCWRASAHVLRMDEDLSAFYASPGRSRPRVGGGGRRPDAARPDRVRGRREDDLHDELHVERHGADGERARDPARRPRERRRRPAGERVPHAGGDGRRAASRSTARSSAPAIAARTCRALARAVAAGSSTSRASATATPQDLPTRSSRPRCSRCPASARTPPRTS